MNSEIKVFQLLKTKERFWYCQHCDKATKREYEMGLHYITAKHEKNVLKGIPFDSKKMAETCQKIQKRK